MARSQLCQIFSNHQMVGVKGRSKLAHPRLILLECLSSLMQLTSYPQSVGTKPQSASRAYAPWAIMQVATYHTAFHQKCLEEAQINIFSRSSLKASVKLFATFDFFRSSDTKLCRIPQCKSTVDVKIWPNADSQRMRCYICKISMRCLKELLLTSLLELYRTLHYCLRPRRERVAFSQFHGAELRSTENYQQYLYLSNYILQSTPTLAIKYTLSPPQVSCLLFIIQWIIPVLPCCKVRF